MHACMRWFAVILAIIQRRIHGVHSLWMYHYSLHAQNPGQKRRCVHVRWPRQCCHLVSHFEYRPMPDGGTDGAVDAEKNAACNAVM